MKVRIYQIDKTLPLPSRAHPTDAGWDVYCAYETKFYTGETKLVPLGIIAEAPEGFHFELVLRSSLAWKKRFRLANSVGIIDCTYAGPMDEIKMMLEYVGPPASFVIKDGERIGQLLLKKNYEIEWDVQEHRDFASLESRGGFGSTGEK